MPQSDGQRVTTKDRISRREEEYIQADDCDKGQHVLYKFLTDLSNLTFEVKSIASRVEKIEGDNESLKKTVGVLAESVKVSGERQVLMLKDFKIASDKLDNEADESKKAREQQDSMAKKINDIAVSQQKIEPLFKMWEKGKNLIFIVLAAYLLKDSPEALKIVSAAIK